MTPLRVGPSTSPVKYDLDPGKEIALWEKYVQKFRERTENKGLSETKLNEENPLQIADKEIPYA